MVRVIMETVDPVVCPVERTVPAALNDMSEILFNHSQIEP